jgi:hypothetical protein
LVEQGGEAVTVFLTRRAAIALADQLLALIPTLPTEGGAL